MTKDPEVRFANNETARDINRRVVLNLIRARQPVSRADLARFSGMQRSTVSLIIEQLIAERWVEEGALGNLPRGTQAALPADQFQPCRSDRGGHTAGRNTHGGGRPERALPGAGDHADGGGCGGFRARVVPTGGNADRLAAGGNPSKASG